MSKRDDWVKQGRELAGRSIDRADVEGLFREAFETKEQFEVFFHSYTETFCAEAKDLYDYFMSGIQDKPVSVRFQKKTSSLCKECGMACTIKNAAGEGYCQRCRKFVELRETSNDIT